MHHKLSFLVVSSKMALVMTKLLKARKNVALSFSLRLWTCFAISHASLRAHRSCCKVSSWILSSNLGALGLRSHFRRTPCDGPFPSRFFLRGAVYLLRHARCASVTRILSSSVRSTWISAALHPGIRNPTPSNSSRGQQILFPLLFFGSLLG